MTSLEEMIEKSVRLAPVTRTHYLASVRDFLAFAGPDPKDWTGTNVELWRDVMVAQKLKPQTINHKLRALSYAAKRLVQRGDLKANFVTYAEKLRAPPADEPRPVTQEVAARIIAACAGDWPADARDRAMILVGFRTGLRLHELLQLGFETVGMPHLRDADVVLKGGARHHVYLDDECVAVLRPLVEWLENRGIHGGPFFRQIGRRRPDLSFPIGDGLTPNGAYKIIVARGAAAGVEDFNPHRMRHSHVSWRRARGDTYEDVRKSTGQRSTGTVDHYAHEVAPPPPLPPLLK